MTIDELIEELCPFWHKEAKLFFKIGFKYATAWWLAREKVRHQGDIDGD